MDSYALHTALLDKLLELRYTDRHRSLSWYFQTWCLHGPKDHMCCSAALVHLCAALQREQETCVSLHELEVNSVEVLISTIQK